MLKQLYIKNFTLIDELNISLYPGFSVITGETGAGKSIILGAIGLLLGNRADSKAIKAGRDRCVIEAHFDLSRYGMQKFFDDHDIDYDADDTIIRRELTAAGKSRAFINDTPVPLTRMRELGEQLVDIHSQHQNLLLQKEDFQLNVVDIIAQDADQLKVYQKEYYAYRKAKELLEELKAEIAANERQLTLLRHKQQQLENRAAYYEKGDRRKRAHRLITRGAAIESVAPLAKILTETEFYAFAEKAFVLPEVKGLLMEAVNEHNKNEFGGDWPSHYSIFM